MANGYIGKISAVVTANTSDLSRKLTEGRDKVKVFANSLNASISSASRQASASLEKIFTPLQRLERKLQTALRLNLRTEDQVGKIRQLVSAAEQINKPLSQAADSFGRLSSEVQAVFFPALRRAQNETVKVSNEIERAGKVSADAFGEAERAVNSLVNAERRLLQVQDLVTSGFTGRELQFSNPRTFAALQAAAQASQRAATLPPSQIESGDIARRVQSLQRLRDQINKQFARVSEIRLRPNVDASLLAGAERRLDQLVARTEAASRQLDAISAKGARTKGLNLALTGRPQDLQQVESIYGRIVAQVQSLDAAQRRAFAPNLRTLGKLIDSGDEARLKDARALIVSLQRELSKQGKVSIEVGEARKRLTELKAEVQGLDAAQRRAFGANLRRLSSLVRTDDASKLADIRKLIQEIDRDLAKQLKINLKNEEAKQRIDEIKARLKGISDSLAGRQSDPFDRLAASAERARAAVERLADSRRKTSLQGRIAGIEGGIAAAAAPGSGLTEAQLAAAARRRAAQLDRIAATASSQPQTARDIFGPALRSSQQRIEALRSQIQSAQSSIAALPGPIQTRLIPLLNQARDAFASLGKTPTAAEIRRAAQQAAELEKQLKRAQQAAKFSGTLGSFFSSTAAERYESQLKAARSQLLALGVAARGPVADAYNKLEAALSKSAQRGTLGTQRTKAEVDKLIASLERALVATGRLTAERAKAFGAAVRGAGTRLGGDIGRGGADRFTLGFQQALFAVDDFFSVTGDLQQRVRAIGNNLTQLGFIVGGTKGLFVTLGAVLGLQVVAAFLKVRNGGKELEDQTRALTNALQEQKRALDAILQSFDQVAGDIADRGLTTATKRAEELAKRLREIAREQEKLQRNRLVELDPEVQERRSNQATLQRRLEQSRRPAERVALQSLIDRERQLELEAADRAFAGRGDGGAAFARRQAEEITSILERQRYFQILAQEDTSFSSPAAVRRRAAEQAGLAFDGVDFADRRAIRAAAVRERERLAELAARPDDFIGNALAFTDQPAFPEAQEALGALEQFIRRLDATAQIEGLTQSVVKAANSVDSSLPKTLAQLEQAAEANVGGARGRIEALEGLSLDLQKQVELARDAFKRFTEGDEGAAAEAKATRDRAAAIAQVIEAEQEKAAVLDSTRRSLETFSAALDRISTQLANTVAQEARGLADQARRDANREQGIVGLGGRQGDADAAARRRARLEAEADDFARRAAAIEADNARARIDFERQAQAGGLGPRAQNLIRGRDAAQAVIDNRQSPAADVINAQATLNVINTELQQIFEQSGAGQAAANLADELNKAAAAAARRDELIQRGRELSLSPAEQAGRQLADDLRALRAARDESIAGGADLVVADRAEAADRNRIIDDALRAEAPAIFGLADQVQNAILQGPSRAALEATDVSTVEGARELNRLLRGDDAARNQDLVQLQREANRLLQLIAEGGAPVAN